MAIQNNVLTEIGDKLFLNSQIAIFGEANFVSIVENVSGVTADRYFTKKFRWSKDNLVYSDWQELNIQNLSEINGEKIDVLFINFFYERSGIDKTGVLIFEDLKFLGSIILQINDYSSTNESIFKDFTENDSLTVAVANNLLKKIYKKGILPNYIKRETNNDTDFISFWAAVCQFFSYFTGLANRFDNILNDKELLSAYLRQRGLKFVESETTIGQLQHLSNNFFDELRKRGTKASMVHKGHVFKDGSVNEIDGEWLRVLGKNHYDEFLVEFIRKEDNGFYVDLSSNLYNGSNQSSQLNKAPENTPDFKSLLVYKILNRDAGSASIIDFSGMKVLEVKSLAGATETPDSFGIGIDLNNIPEEIEPEFLIKVDPEVDYEFTFKLKKSAFSGNTAAKIKVGVLGFNVNNWKTIMPFKDSKTGVVSEVFFDKDFSSVLKTSEWYFFRCIIFARGSLNTATENDFGYKSLTFSENTYKVLPYINLNDSTTGSTLLIHDFKFRPLSRGNNILKLKRYKSNRIDFDLIDPQITNPCFVQNDCSVLTWTKNNSTESDESVENFVNEFLLPYQKNLFNIRLSPKTNDKQLLT